MLLQYLAHQLVVVRLDDPNFNTSLILILAKPSLGAASAAPASTSGAGINVPPPSMLRGKTIEEIVNKWSSDLEVHYKEFNRLAGEVAVWDRALIDNGNTVKD